MLKKLSVALAVGGILSACATSPTGRNQLIFMPDSQMNQMGLQAFDQMKKEKPVNRSVQFNQTAQCIVTELTQGMGQNWEVVVFEDKTLNAFALPGAKIGVHTGMMQLVDNQDQLAAVLGHEVGHVIARHSNERASQQTLVEQSMGMIQNTTYGQNPLIMAGLGLGAQYGILMPYSRTHESEADMIGVDLMAKAGFDPQQSVNLWQKMEQASQGQQPSEFLSTHPSHSTRIKELQDHMPKALEFYKQAQAENRKPQCQ